MNRPVAWRQPQERPRDPPHPGWCTLPSLSQAMTEFERVRGRERREEKRREETDKRTRASGPVNGDRSALTVAALP